MGYELVGGPQDGQFVEEIPEGYVAQGINAGVVSHEGGSPVRRATWRDDLDEMNRIIDAQGYRSTDDQ